MDRLRRSALYLPASNPRAIAKSKSLDCDVVLLDLEDAVAPDAKSLAREHILAALANAPSRAEFGERELVIRVNGPETQWYDDDLRATVEANPNAILLPKVDRAEQVRQLIADFARHGGSPDVRVWCMMETPKGILQADAIGQAHPKLECLVMGTSDLTQDMRALHTSLRLPMLTSLGLCLLAARAHGLSILDGVALDLADQSGFVAACTQGRELGFDGKTLIHPNQIGPCNAAFSPSEDAVERARRVLDAFAQARSAGKGVVVLEGRLVEELHVREAQRTLALHEALDSRTDPQIRSRR